MIQKEHIRKIRVLEWEDLGKQVARSEFFGVVWKMVSAISNSSSGLLVLGVTETGEEFKIDGGNNAKKLEPNFLNTIRGTKFKVFFK
jgi:predicted HTH transcriptional regulator